MEDELRIKSSTLKCYHSFLETIGSDILQNDDRDKKGPNDYYRDQTDMSMFLLVQLRTLWIFQNGICCFSRVCVCVCVCARACVRVCVSRFTFDIVKIFI